MILINGKPHLTIADAAKAFGVSPKTVRQWIEKGIIDKPAEVQYGLRLVMHFPKSYLDKAQKQLQLYRSQRNLKSEAKGNKAL